MPAEQIRLVNYYGNLYWMREFPTELDTTTHDNIPIFRPKDILSVLGNYGDNARGKDIK